MAYPTAKSAVSQHIGRFVKDDPFRAIFMLLALLMFSLMGLDALTGASAKRDAEDARTLPYCTQATPQERAHGRCLPTGYIRP